MQTRCPNCSTIVKSKGDSWELINSSCVALAGTEWDGKAEYCPLLSLVVAPEVTLPGLAIRLSVQAEIDKSKVKRLK